MSDIPSESLEERNESDRTEQMAEDVGGYSLSRGTKRYLAVVLVSWCVVVAFSLSFGVQAGALEGSDILRVTLQLALGFFILFFMLPLGFSWMSWRVFRKSERAGTVTFITVGVLIVVLIFLINAIESTPPSPAP